MYRVELKARHEHGLEIGDTMFLMYRVELKVEFVSSLKASFRIRFLMYRVELKEYFGIKGKLYYFGS